jgi:hypothetical protein
LKQRLGIDVGIAEPLPDKPKGMWARTYGCLLDGILHAEMLAHEAQSSMFKRLLDASLVPDRLNSSKSLNVSMATSTADCSFVIVVPFRLIS